MGRIVGGQFVYVAFHSKETGEKVIDIRISQLLNFM